YRDVESLNVYEIKRAQGMDENEILEILKHKSRDNSRTPVQWSDEPNAGFTKGKPWINPADNYREINVEKALDDEDSIFYFYQKLIALRKQYEIITYGNYELILGEDEQIFAYIRNGADEKLLVINNFYGSETIFQLPENLTFEGYYSEILLSNYEDSSKELKRVLLRPYESIVYHLKK
ncbi:alpha amylase C-terminal domain-containing protein, partial [Priestia megaterium]